MKKTVVARAVSAALIILAASFSTGKTALAQSNATGTVFGTIPAGSGDSVLIESLATNAKRTSTPDRNGKYQATALPPGRYRVTFLKGSTVVSTTEVEVLLGQGVEASFVGGEQLNTVQVTGTRSVIDVSTTNNGSTFTSRQLAALPIAQNITAIMLLAPDVVKADPRYAGGASIGGGAPSENSYYINGFPVTNALSQLGSIELPFGAIQQAQILTGGFGAEFGRSTGGVVNITTKSGTNEWHGGAAYSIQPSALRAREKNILYPQTGSSQNTGTDGKLYLDQHDTKKTETTVSGNFGGPIIKDKLFLFFAADVITQHISGVNDSSGSQGNVISSTLASNGWQDLRNENKRYLGKLDWNITDQHRLEFTTLGDNYRTDESNYGFDYATLTRGGVKNYTAYYKNQANITTGVGGSANILKYTGNLTQDFTVQALYGESRSPHAQTYVPDLSGGVPGSVFSTSSARAPGINYGTAQPLSGQNISPASSNDSTKSFRLDFEYSLGAHTLRAGYDQNKLSSQDAGEAAAGGSTYSYRFTGTPGTARHFGPYTYVIADGSVLGNAGFYVRQRTFSDTTNARSDQSAEYIEDRWQATTNFLVTLGLRNEGFKGYNGEGEAYINSKNFISPRLGGAWDVLGDSSLKVFGNLGRYSIQTPTHVAVRGAGVSTLVDQYFTYTGVNGNGIPTGLHALTAQPFSPDGETGQAKDPNSVAAKDLKPSYQDELILGVEKAFTAKLTAGTKLTYRRLGSTLDDVCDERPFDKYADDHGIDRKNYSFSCLEFNPGRTNKFLVDYAGNKTYTPVSLTRADFGFEKPKRTFFALDFFLEHPFVDGWYGKVVYTWSKNKGNTEGQTKSDNGQTDVSATSTWDFHEIMENTYGYLPNDRTHQIKAIGYYKFLPEWIVGGNLAAASGRPKNCNGNYGGTSPDGDYGGYGSVFFYCAGVATPRGSQGRLPWNYSLDMNLAYQPRYVKGLTLRVDVYNVFNKQSVLAISETHELSQDAQSVLPTYGRVIGYSDPRAVRLLAQYDF